MHSNHINKLCYRLKNIENIVDLLLLQQFKPNCYQLFNENSIELSTFTNMNPSFFYETPSDKNLFNININTNDNQKIIKINISTSFITTEGEKGSVILKLKINNTTVTVNESNVNNNGYSHLTLNYIQNIEPNSLYIIEVNYEGLIQSSIILNSNPIISTRNDGASLSILVL